MHETVVNLNDIANIKDDAIIKTINERMSCGAKGTKITLIDHESGKTLGEFENKIVITGSILNAQNVWGIEAPVKFPSYNSEMNLDNTKSYQERLNVPKVCLFCVDDSGCGTTPKDVYTGTYISRIKPAPKDPSSVSEFKSDMIMPFRFVSPNEDLNKDLRKYYFGRKTFSKLNKIGYYFKKFDTDPMMHIRYADGTQITENVYTYNSNQAAEVFVQVRLRITRLDFRDYFEQVLGWDKARISSVSLAYAWYDETIDNYRWYQDIFPYSKLNFPYEHLVDATKGIDIVYNVYY